MASVTFKGASRHSDSSDNFIVRGYKFPKDVAVSNVPQDVIDRLEGEREYNFEIGPDVKPEPSGPSAEERRAQRKAARDRAEAKAKKEQAAPEPDSGPEQPDEGETEKKE